MTPAQFLLCLACLFLVKMVQRIHLTSSSSVYQESSFISAHVGDDVTLKCFYKSTTWLFWFMQPLGGKPTLISTFYVNGLKITYQGKFKNNPRYSLTTENRTHHLTVLDLKSSDSATYYCAARHAVELDFADGTTVSVKDSDSNIKPLIHESSLEIIQPGDSVTLSCTVQTGTCDGEHSVYWFKDSGESHPALLYTHGDTNDQCERNPNTQTHTCVYNLLMKNLNVSHAGTYYCAVASCGYILFGNGTKLDFNGEVDFEVLVYVLTGTLIFTTIIVVLLIYQVYKMRKRIQCSEERFPSPPTASTVSTNEETNSPQYASLELNRLNRSRRQRSTTKSDCVYSSVRQ